MSVSVVRRAERQQFVFDGVPASVSKARHRLLDVAEPFVEDHLLPDLQLVITEVVSNAIRHGSDDGPVIVAVTPKDDYLCVQVTDSGAGLAPRPRATAPDDNGGFGFFLIEQLTRRWGMTREGGRTRVWFEFDFSD